jgi:hypothetical protein
MSIPLTGIFFKDELPRKMEYNKAYIINIQDSHDGEGLENSGTHWVCLYSTKYPNGNIEPIYFDSYGQAPPENVKAFVKNSCNKYLPYTTKDVQSLMSEVCGWYCCAFLYACTHPNMKCGDLYEDVDNFLGMFEDLTKSADFKKNELILKCFFRSEDPSKRTPIDLDIANQEDNPNIIKVPITTRMV